MQEYDIQTLVERSGVPRRTIHFYIQQNILPPPHGAGLAARYDEGHLLRLRLIPHLRAKGLRLDQIRVYFNQASPEELQLEAERILSAPPPLPPPPILASPAAAPALLGERPPLVNGVPHLHYALPGGVTLVVPADLAAEYRPGLEALLEAAQTIFFK